MHVLQVPAVWQCPPSKAVALTRCLLSQEFAEARRAAACGDAPRCVYTHPGVRSALMHARIAMANAQRQMQCGLEPVSPD